MNFKHVALIAGALTFAGVASATPVSGSALQTGLDNISDGGDFYDVNTSQYNPDEVWNVTSSNGSVTSLIFEFAGFANIAEFGIYDVADQSNKLKIYDGANCGAAQGCSAMSYLDLIVNPTGGQFWDGTYQFTNGALGESATFASGNFGYYLSSGAGTFYSQSSLNGDSDNDGFDDDHMVAYQGDDALGLDITGGTNYKNFSSGEFVLAWEDLALNSSDRDYSDFVVLVESVRSVFEPGSMALFGLGIAGLAASRRRQKGQKA